MILAGSPLDVYRRDPTRPEDLDVCLHGPQRRVMNSDARFVAAIAGSQSGKTVLGPPWMTREMALMGPGEYMVISPNYRLMQRKVLPILRLFFEDLTGIASYQAGAQAFVVTPDGEQMLWGDGFEDERRAPTTIFLSHAMNSGSLESATLKGAWLDEVGQKQFRLDSWEATLRRLSLFRARALLTTTPYNFGWLKQRVYDRWRAGDPDYEVVSFPSTANPFFSREEDARLRQDLPDWKYKMFHLGLFTRPAGLIYDPFSSAPYPEGHVAGRFEIPRHWPRHVGLDFGGVNTAAVFYAEEPDTDRLWLYREYWKGSRTGAEHARAIRRGEPEFATVTGGASSEGQWRREFRAAGLPIKRPPISDVEVGIDRVYGCHKRSEIVAFADCSRYLEQKQIYSRELDETGEPTTKIEDKEKFHLLDAERYAIARLRPSRPHAEQRAPRAKAYGF